MIRKGITITALAFIMVAAILSIPAMKLNRPAIVHASGTCAAGPQSATASTLGVTAILSIPALPSGCVKTVVTFISATMADASEGCLEDLHVLDGTTVVMNDNSFISNTTGHLVDHIVYAFPAIQASGPNNDLTGFTGLWLTNTNGGTIEFTGHCANSHQTINAQWVAMP
jgi:hypothetical protein